MFLVGKKSGAKGIFVYGRVWTLLYMPPPLRPWDSGDGSNTRAQLRENSPYSAQQDSPSLRLNIALGHRETFNEHSLCRMRGTEAISSECPASSGRDVDPCTYRKLLKTRQLYKYVVCDIAILFFFLLSAVSLSLFLMHAANSRDRKDQWRLCLSIQYN